MAEGDCRKRKFVCFIFFTGFLIFAGMYIQYKMKVLEVPIASTLLTSKTEGSSKSTIDSKSKKNVKSNGDYENEKQHGHNDHDDDDDDNDNEIERYFSDVKSMQKLPLTKRNKKQTKLLQNSNVVHRLLHKYGLDSDIDAIKKIRFVTTTQKSFINKIIKTVELTNKHANVLVQQKVTKKGEFKKRYPKAIIAGVKKGGTRALLSFIAKHPLVRSGGKEMHFFDKNEQYEKGLSFYLEQMPKSFANEMTIEKTPGYFVKSYVPQRIYNFNKEIKLIFIFRDPVQRAISDYAQALSKEGKESKRFEKLVFTKTKPREVDIKNSKVSIGLYVEHLRNWLQYFPLKQMHFVNGDQFIHNPVPEIISVQRFLNLPVMIDKESFFFNKTKGFYCIIVKKEIGGEISSQCLSSSKGRKHPPIKETTLQKLTDFYKPYNRKLFSLIKKNFEWPV